MKKRLLLMGIAIILVIGIIGCSAFDSKEEKPDNGTDETEKVDKEYKLTEDGIIEPDSAREIIEEKADKLIRAISEKDGETIAEFVHPGKGLRFSPYAFVSLEKDKVFNKKGIKDFFKDENVYTWGIYDGIGDDISLTPEEYYEEFIYSKDFKNAEKIGYNEVLSGGNTIENQFEVYERPIIVEYYFPSLFPEDGGMDWKGLRLVFEEFENEWKLVGIIHSQWTI